ncbi:hypothetical protein HY572_00705 [Candidatus Micrarchaeota archaeon]|nr:hypothetical protein [Candidatus Micrarchaeota archaeon]
MPTSLEFYGQIRRHVGPATGLTYEKPRKPSSNHKIHIHGIQPEHALELGETIESQLNPHGRGHVAIGFAKTGQGFLLTLEEPKHVRAVLEALAHHENLRKEAQRVLDNLPK